MADVLDLDLLAPADRVLASTVLVDGSRVRREFPVRGSLSVPEMVGLLRMETRINLSFAEGDAAQMADVLEDAYGLVMRYVREKTPDAPDLDLDQDQTLAAIGFLSGDESASDAVAATLASPDAAEDHPDGVATHPTAAAVAEEGKDPFGSTTDSQKPSYGSDGSTGGGPNGGETSAGEPSGSTFETLTPV